MRFVRPSNSAAIKQMVANLQSAVPNYDDIGATLAGKQPEGFHHDHYEVVLGHGAEVFQRAVTGLKTWKAHRLPGMRVYPGDLEIRTGATVVVTLGTSIVALAAPCRIVAVIDGQTRWGFAYGTLPGHPEQGEEAFVVSISPDQSVHFEIEAFSRPGDSLVRLSGPIGRGVQRGGTGGYLRALKGFVEEMPARS
ncbi:MAG TPA: DUF1990 domain-containing protein [Acidimicrobiales bacterium]|nr:DUF1990 domain-containing protein [Acidimicrobiales bacterium]